jgi:hypothetical protein
LPCDIGAVQGVGQVINFTSTPPTVAAVGGPTYTVATTATSGLPVALTIDNATTSICSISEGVVSFTAVGSCVVDANQSGNADFAAAPIARQTVTVVPLAITTTSLPGGAANTTYSASLAAIGGNLPYTWKISSGTLPKGIKLSKKTGVISGKTKAVGTLYFTVEVLDTKIKVKSHPPTQNTATQALSITIGS